MNVTKSQIEQYGKVFKDRSNSFDDCGDLDLFIHRHLRNNSYFREYITSIVGEMSLTVGRHVDGPMGVDLSLFNHDTGERVLDIDLERWNAWGTQWPTNYRWIHVLGRKTKYVESNVPFLFCPMSRNRDRFLVVDTKVIKKYPVKNKYFVGKGHSDNVREVPMTQGYVFGSYTLREKSLFKTWSETVNLFSIM